MRAEFTIPWDSFLSKNKAKCIRGRGKKRWIGLTDEYKRAKKNTVEIIQPILSKYEWIPKEKVWLDIHVEKPSNRPDAINVIDGLCDAIQEVIKVNDRYYSITGLDWSINKKDPEIRVKVCQDE